MQLPLQGRPILFKVQSHFFPTQSQTNEPIRSENFQVCRQYFDQNAGTTKVETVASSFLPTEVLRLHHLMAASYAVLKYVEHVQNITFSKNGLVIEFQGLKGKLQIDYDSAVNLEIISNKRNGREHSSASLFGLFFCNTVVGARLLRANLLCPPSDLPTIKCRLDSVECLMLQENSEVFFELNQTFLGQFVDLDLLMGSLAFSASLFFVVLVG